MIGGSNFYAPPLRILLLAIGNYILSFHCLLHYRTVVLTATKRKRSKNGVFAHRKTSSVFRSIRSPVATRGEKKKTYCSLKECTNPYPSAVIPLEMGIRDVKGI
jgi:hypothetical protein